jgi:hypothetical protein
MGKINLSIPLALRFIKRRTITLLSYSDHYF